MDPIPAALIERLHNSGRRLVIAVTGGGSGAIAALIRVPGASRLLLEAVVPYASRALAGFLGREPERACSEATATAMAARALERAGRLSDGDAVHLGVGVTATLATDRPKRGAHRCHVAVASAHAIDVTSVELEKGRRSRAEEEDLVARIVLLALARACDVEAPDVAGLLSPGDRLSCTPVDLVDALLGGAVVRVTASADGRSVLDVPHTPGLLPGSFNPLHEGHLELARVASGLLGGAVTFELSVTNVDKPPLPAAEVHRRVAQFGGRGTLELTRAPTFREKARLFPGVTFVVGVDTAVRIVDPRYYGSEAGMREALAEISAARCRFLVAGRLDGAGRFATVASVDVPTPFAGLFGEIPEGVFRSDVSSTSLRARP